MPETTLQDFISGLPKAELHVHICGTLEPGMYFKFARRNGVSIPYATEAVLREAYRFDGLQSFLDLYHTGTQVMQTERDFYELTLAYLRKAHEQAVLHTELSIDPQTFLRRGMPPEPIFDGILNAIDTARRESGISAFLILDFIRDFDEEDALRTLECVEPWLDRIPGIGLGSAEIGHPPSKFVRLYKAAESLGLKKAAHAGEEGPADYVRQAVELLGVDRIDHGIRAMEDAAVMQLLADRQIPVTFCPLSNQALHVTPDLRHYPIREFLAAGVPVTLHSDDPSYFSGYVNENYFAVAKALDLPRETLAEIARHSFRACYLPEAEKKRMLRKVEVYAGG